MTGSAPRRSVGTRLSTVRGTAAPPSSLSAARFRRRPGVARRRRSRLLLLVSGPWPRLALSAAVVAAMGVWLFHSPSLALEHVRVRGTDRVPPGWIEEVLEPHMGTSLLLLPFTTVRQSVAAQPWVQAVEIRKLLPDRLEISVKEHRPAALLRGEGGLQYVSDEGLIITRVALREENSAALRGLLSLRYGGARPWAGEDPQPLLQRALVLAAKMATFEPDWAPLSEIVILGEEDFSLQVASLPFPILVRSGTASEKLQLFAQLLPEILHRYRPLEGVDLRFVRRIVVQPAAYPVPAPGAGV